MSGTIEEKAAEWAIDYKPWQEDLGYREYARYGYEKGYKRAVQDLKGALKAAGLLEQLKTFLGDENG